MRLGFWGIATAIFILIASCAVSSPFDDQNEGALSNTAQGIKADVEWLAADARMGRSPGSKEYLVAADYVSKKLQEYSVEPGADGEWKQVIQFRKSEAKTNTLTMSITDQNGYVHQLNRETQFNFFPGAGEAGLNIENAPVIFVGYGVHAPIFGFDDYKYTDVSGKVVVFISGAPNEFSGDQKVYFSSSMHKRAEAQQRGAVATIELSRKKGDELGSVDKAPRVSRSITEWLQPDGTPKTETIAQISLNENSLETLFSGTGYSVDEIFVAEATGGFSDLRFSFSATISMKGEVERTYFTSPNVVGIIEGSDPERRDEVVVLTAHLDHHGVNRMLIDEGRNGIYNGAIDNASGVAVLFEVARIIQAGPRPARSIAFVALTSEEVGLLGSDYFANYPHLNDGTIVANVNFDMPVLLHNFTNIVGFGATHSSLGKAMENALKNSGIELATDPIPQLGIFMRSDHSSFVRQGIPSIYPWTGFANGGEKKFWNFFENHYHRTSDDINQPILYNEMQRFSEISAKIVIEIANEWARPTWNDDDFYGDQFGTGK